MIYFGDLITDDSIFQLKISKIVGLIYSQWTSYKKETSDIAVVNKGIGSNKITIQGLERYSYDILDVKRITHIIILYGVNNINSLNATSSEIISAYK